MSKISKETVDKYVRRIIKERWKNEARNEYFGNIYWNPSKPWWLPRRLWQRILDKHFEKRWFWMADLKKKHRNYFKKLQPLSKLRGRV